MVKQHACYYLFIALFICLYACHDESTAVKNIHHFIPPIYNQVGLTVTSDTIRFPFLDSLHYYKVQSFNLFKHNGVDYIALFDSKEVEEENKHQSIFIYEFFTRQLITQIPIRRFLDNRNPFFTAAYVKNFDSIFVFSEKNVQLVDSGGSKRKKISFLKARPQMQFYNNGTPPVFSNSKFYTGVKAPVTETQIKQLKDERVLYEFDMQKDTATLFYQLPELYFNQSYGNLFLQSSYCFNESERFVFSFPADTAIYESDLHGYNISYCGKSKFQTNDIKPIGDGGIRFRLIEGGKNYFLNDAYSVIYFDKFHKRYLRVVFHKMSEIDYQSKKVRAKSIIIFDDKLRIIGETIIKENINLERLFFTDSGYIYAELMMPKPRYDIRFVRLMYD